MNEIAVDGNVYWILLSTGTCIGYCCRRERVLDIAVDWNVYWIAVDGNVNGIAVVENGNGIPEDRF